MSEYVTDEAVNAALRASDSADEGGVVGGRERMMRAALAAAFPLIAAKAWEQGYAASQLEWKHVYDGHTVEPGDESGMCTECGQGNPYEVPSQPIKYPEVTVKLVGEDGNAFFIIGRTSQALRLAGVSQEEISAFQAEAMSGDYDNVLQTVMKWVDTE